MLKLTIAALMAGAVALAGPATPATFCSGSPNVYAGGSLTASPTGFSQDSCTVSGDTTFDLSTYGSTPTSTIPFTLSNSKITTAAKLTFVAGVSFPFAISITKNQFTDGAALVIFGSLPASSSVSVSGNSFVSDNVLLQTWESSTMAASLLWTGRSAGTKVMATNADFTIKDNEFDFSPPSSSSLAAPILFPSTLFYTFSNARLKVTGNTLQVVGDPSCTGDCKVHGMYSTKLDVATTTVTDNKIEVSSANAMTATINQGDLNLLRNTLSVKMAGIALNLDLSSYTSAFTIADNKIDTQCDAGKNAIAGSMAVRSDTSYDNTECLFEFKANSIISTGANDATNVAWKNSRLYFGTYSPYNWRSSAIIAGNTFTETDPSVTGDLVYMVFNTIVTFDANIHFYQNYVGSVSVSNTAMMFSFPAFDVEYSKVHFCLNYFRDGPITDDASLEAVTIGYQPKFRSYCPDDTQTFTTVTHILTTTVAETTTSETTTSETTTSETTTEPETTTSETTTSETTTSETTTSETTTDPETTTSETTTSETTTSETTTEPETTTSETTTSETTTEPETTTSETTTSETTTSETTTSETTTSETTTEPETTTSEPETTSEAETTTTFSPEQIRECLADAKCASFISASDARYSGTASILTFFIYSLFFFLH